MRVQDVLKKRVAFTGVLGVDVARAAFVLCELGADFDFGKSAALAMLTMDQTERSLISARLNFESGL